MAEGEVVKCHDTWGKTAAFHPPWELWSEGFGWGGRVTTPEKYKEQNKSNQQKNTNRNKKQQDRKVWTEISA